MLYVAATGALEPNGPVLFWVCVETARWAAPVLIAALLASLGAGLAQSGLNFAPAALTPKFDRFSPAGRIKQIFSAAGLSNLLKSLLPFGVIAWIAVAILEARWSSLVGASGLGLQAFASLVGSMAFELVWKSAVVLLGWAAVDYLLVWKKTTGDLKMTKQEIREESKETDGNPIVKQRIHRIRRMMRRSQSLKAAATATVVITNPTHFAVALRYESGMDAPKVVAKGLDLLAEKIKQMARESGIMLVENRPLAQALYKTVEVSDSIPAKLYQAVAEILVLVYRAEADLRRQDEMRRSRNASGRQTNPATPRPEARA